MKNLGLHKDLLSLHCELRSALGERRSYATNPAAWVSTIAEHPAGNRVERITVRTLALVTLLAATPGIVASQEITAPSRAQDVAAAFSKHKHLVKEKRGVRREQYVDVRSEPLVAHTSAEYSGVYQVVGLGDVIHLQIGSDGTIQAAGHDSEPSRSFVLANARIEGAVLTATKVFRDGAAEPFEGVFMTRTERRSPTDPGKSSLGLGVVLHTPREVAGNTYDKLFYQLQR